MLDDADTRAETDAPDDAAIDQAPVGDGTATAANPAAERSTEGADTSATGSETAGGDVASSSDPLDAPADPALSALRAALRIKLDSFEGPLDLLLHLIRREKLDIHDVPIARITHQYLEMIQTMQLLNLEVAGEFLVMASTLMRIKARTLLPPSPLEDDDEESIQTREDLIRRLIEYRKYKEVATHLRGHEESRAHHHAKGYTPRIESDEPLPLKPTSLFRLVDVLREVLARQREIDPVHQVQLPPVTVEERMEHIREMLAGAWGQMRFEEVLVDCRTRIEIITTFMALLELIRLGEVMARQYEEFGDIWLFEPERLRGGLPAIDDAGDAEDREDAVDSGDADPPGTGVPDARPPAAPTGEDPS
ncbi:MAG: segregation/condensation protein A [Candidatus Eiseniibacteriota bacterium]|jgi:segregation and condensation protein A